MTGLPVIWKDPRQPAPEMTSASSALPRPLSLVLPGAFLIWIVDQQDEAVPKLSFSASNVVEGLYCNINIGFISAQAKLLGGENEEEIQQSRYF